MRTFLALLVGLTLLAALAVGCGRKKVQTARAEGKVLYRGQPVTGGTIRFFRLSGEEFADQPVAQGIISGDGTFTVPGVPMGTYRIAIETESVKGRSARGGMGLPAGGKVPIAMQIPPGMAMPVYLPIPPRYADPNRSGLTWRLDQKENKRDFDLP